MNGCLNVKDLRLKYKMSQSEFAKYLNIPVRTIQSWEQGARKPSIYLLDLMNKYLELTLRG